MKHQQATHPSIGSRAGAILVLLVLALLPVLATACGSSDDSDEGGGGGATTAAASSGVEEAQKIVAASSKPPEFVAPSSFDASPAQGKTVWWIADQNTEIVNIWRQAAEKAFSEAGVKFKLYDTKNSIPEHIRAFETAIAGGADAIVMADGYPAEAFSEQIADAKKAGIPVISTVSGEPGNPPKVPGVVADVTYDYPEVGRLLAAWFVADSNGEGKALALSRSDIASSIVEMEAMQKEIARLCPDCEVEQKDVTGENQTTEIPNLVQTAISTDPELDYVLPAFDSMALYALPAITQAGAGDRVKVGAYNATSAMMKNLKNGTPFKMDIGGPNEWFSYAIADTVLRVFAGEPVEEDPKIGLEIFTEESVQDIDVSKVDDQKYYGQDYTQDYPGIWGG